MRIGVLGGSFDPVHHGHLIVGQLLRERLELDAVLFIPAGEQPFKVGRHAAPAADRAAMVGLAVAGEVGLRLDRSEVDRPGPSYTVDTLRELSTRFPGAELTLLVGSEVAADLGRWREAAVIPTLARIVVFSRPGYRPHDAGMGQDGVIDVPTLAISSTAIRARVSAGRSIRYWVPDAVADHIATHRLYRDGST